MIGYDIDGVLVNDIVFDNSHELSDLLKYRCRNLAPIFVPDGDYCLITGRPIQDKQDTMLWVNKFFETNPPVDVYHDNPNMVQPVLYKEQVLRENPNITVFIESELLQVLYLKDKFPERTIVHFSTMVGKSIEWL